MTSQLALPFALADAPLAACAAEWMLRHPEAMRLFRLYARQMLDRGRRFGMKALAERVRWEHALLPDDAETWKLNNNHVAYIARRLCEEMPGLEALIELRQVRGDQG